MSNAALKLLVLLLAATPAVADLFHLEQGRAVEGRLLGEEGGFYRVRTIDGVVSIPTRIVERIEPGPTVLDEYESRLKSADATADAQAQLGIWCLEQGLRTEGRKHLQAAIAANPGHRAARQALGYVQVGGLWVEGRSSSRRAPEPAAEDEESRLLAGIRREWSKQIAVIDRLYLNASDPNRVASGRDQTLAIKDPLAIGAVVDRLTRGGVATRRLLVEFLSQFPTEAEATLHLAIMGLVETDDGVRKAAVVALCKRDDPQIIAQYMKALRVRSDIVIKRAAYALGEMKAALSAADLIDLLTEVKPTWVETPVRDYFELWPQQYYRSIEGVPVGGLRVGDHAFISRYIYADQTINEWQYRSVTVFRSEVRDALVKITGQDFGFERDAWIAWYRAQQPVSP